MDEASRDPGIRNSRNNDHDSSKTCIIELVRALIAHRENPSAALRVASWPVGGIQLQAICGLGVFSWYHRLCLFSPGMSRLASWRERTADETGRSLGAASRQHTCSSLLVLATRARRLAILGVNE
ncbi:hypothetical protein C8035_v009730 [Colletotrichum spinosum]|uniref:Uncharacterized protein n=1 Tax=Colletotrichum spinosum TaxID=1347390 RepID=A0A4R8QAB0_9PEZI|nr:hypothetical protein C8035_v009730 [Colletotrichum spinosum]